jgi:hypothetical protein
VRIYHQQRLIDEASLKSFFAIQLSHANFHGRA